MTTRLSLLLLTIHAVSVAGWGQRFEMASIGGGIFGVSSTALKASAEREHDPQEIGAFRQRLEQSFGVFDGDSVDAMSSFVFRRDIEEQRLLDMEGECEGDECDSAEECQIPDAFKVLPDESAVDVMAFLGIKRAEPLRPKTNAGDWQ
ncbi:expressed unknown protein [Seminavis robusta]|uniref:Uncharacterized protein n=1 Tax=Seminavis robusta TaxID=568900 RepID=A0A9N8HDX3_9STRA|nr:expressed unknown protein [Seminavis robusta]|eukprot:Sro276_g105990.1 n/a (148) ;mRNA; r:39070-39513